MLKQSKFHKQCIPHNLEKYCCMFLVDRPRLSGKKCQGSPNQYRILIPGRNGICKPFNMRQLVSNLQQEKVQGMEMEEKNYSSDHLFLLLIQLLSGEIDWETIRQNGCSYKNDNITKWRVYRESEQRRQGETIMHSNKVFNWIAAETRSFDTEIKLNRPLIFTSET